MAHVRQKKTAAALFAAAACLAAICFWFRADIELPLLREIPLDSPYIIKDTTYSRYILDKQRTRIIQVDKTSNTVKSFLPKGSGKKADIFYYADDFTADEDGYVYIKEGAWDGNRISREAVLIYDKNGRYITTCLDTRYTVRVNKHKIMLLACRDGKVHYARKDSNAITLSSFDIQRGTETARVIQFKHAFDFIGDMTEDSAGNVYVLDKTGCIFKLNDDKTEFTLLYRAPADEYPGWIEPSSNGKLFFTDLYTDSVIELDTRTGEKHVAVKNAGSVTVTPVPFSTLQNPVKSKNQFFKQVLLLAVFALFVLCTLAFAVVMIIMFFKSSMHIIRRISFYIIIIVVVVAGTVTYKLTNEFSKVMRAQILAQMENMAYSVANTIRPATLDSIQTAADFASQEYRDLIRSMENVIDPDLTINNNVYCDIFKYDEKHGAYACAYLDQAIGTYYPLTEGEAAEIKQIYELGQSVRSSKNDTSASYTYVSVPVINDDGRVCGVVSVMTENYMLMNQINDMKQSVLLGLVVTLIFVWLAMGEALSYILSKSQAQMEAQERMARGEPEKKSFPHYYIRLMVFALFAAYNMTTTFLPMVIANGAIETLGGRGGSFAAAIPISVNLFIIGLMALFCERIIRRAGFTKVIAIGAGLSAASNLLIFAFMYSYPVLFFALVIDGIGVGLTTNSLYMMVSQIPDAKNRTSGYAAYNAAQISGINFGMLCGAFLVQNIGRQLVFPLVTVMWLVSALLFMLLWQTLGIAAGSMHERRTAGYAEASKTAGKTMRILSFLSKRRVWSFILLAQAPFALMGSFVYYYLPLYSEANGLSEVIVAVLMMLYSMFAIYLGNKLTKWVVQKTGALSPYAAIILCIAAVLTYAVSRSFSGFFAAIFILGLANGFGRSVLQAHFSLLQECEEFGLPDAMGIFNFTDFIGQSFGPAVMGMVFLSKNMTVSAAVFAIILTLVCTAHFIINKTKTIRS